MSHIVSEDLVHCAVKVKVMLEPVEKCFG